MGTYRHYLRVRLTDISYTIYTIRIDIFHRFFCENSIFLELEKQKKSISIILNRSINNRQSFVNLTLFLLTIM